MKTEILLIVMLVVSIIGYGQNEFKKGLPEVEVTAPEFTNIENVAMLLNKNNTALLANYLNEKVQYPEKAAECYIQGTVVVQFIVTKEGEVTDFKVINSVCPLIDNEIISVLKTTNGMWNPGYNNEKPVDMEQEVSMMFVASKAFKNSPLEYFTRMAKLNWIKGNKLYVGKDKPRKALKYYNESVKYLPYDPSALMLRGLCKYELGDRKGARSDWERINNIGKYDADEFIQKLTYLKGYDEMNLVLNRK